MIVGLLVSYLKISSAVLNVYVLSNLRPLNCGLTLGHWQGRNHGWKVEGDQGLESQHRGACAPRPAKGRAGCWVREGVAPLSLWGAGV